MAFLIRLGLLIRHTVLPVAHAACSCPAGHIVCICTGTAGSSVAGIMGNIVNLLLYWSSFVAAMLFIVGGILMIGSGGSDTFLSTGKKIMKGSLIGFAIVLGSWMILSTVLYFITF